MRRRLFGSRSAIAGLVAASLTSFASVASAEGPYVDRHIVLEEHDWAFDFGLGVGHDNDQPRSPTGAGLNFEMAVSPVDRLELGVRSGVRFGDDARAVQADAYGRLFDRPTFGTNNDVFANPEIRVRGALLRGDVAEIALEGRVFLPAEQFSEIGLMFGVPFLFHLGGIARIDTGVFVPVVFYSPADAWISLPVDVWFQVTRRLWLGPMSGLDFHATRPTHADVPLGFGLGYQILRTLDLKTQFLFPAINQTEGARTFGFGVGLEVRIE